MERLTKRGAITQKDIKELLEYSNENQFGPNEAYHKLKHYEDLEEEGKLIELPCAVGTTYYYLDLKININEDKCKNCPHLCGDTLDGFWCLEADASFSNYEPKECLEIVERKFYSQEGIVANKSSLGVSIFLTREEAEKRLEDLKSN